MLRLARRYRHTRGAHFNGKRFSRRIFTAAPGLPHRPPQENTPRIRGELPANFPKSADCYDHPQPRREEFSPTPQVQRRRVGQPLGPSISRYFTHPPRYLPTTWTPGNGRRRVVKFHRINNNNKKKLWTEQLSALSWSIDFKLSSTFQRFPKCGPLPDRSLQNFEASLTLYIYIPTYVYFEWCVRFNLCWNIRSYSKIITSEILRDIIFCIGYFFTNR